MLRLLLVLLATGCATLEPPVNFEREGGDKSPTQQKEGAPLKVASEQEIQTLRPPIKIVGPFKAENDLSEPPNGEENAATDFAAEEEVKIPLTQQQAKLTERIKSAYAAQLELKEQLIKDLERQLAVMTSETDEKMKSVEELVGLLSAINQCLLLVFPDLWLHQIIF